MTSCAVADLGEGLGGPAPPLFWVKKEEMTEGKMGDRASKSRPDPPLPPPPISSRSGSATGALGRVTSWPRRKQRNKKYVILKAERYTSDIENVPCKTYLFLFCKVPLTKRERNYRPRMLSRFCLDHLFIVLSQQGKFEIAHENTSHYKAMHLLYIEIYDIDQRMRL